jgi:hypothetical protein
MKGATVSRIGRAVLGGLLVAAACIAMPAGTATADTRVDGPACTVRYTAQPTGSGFTAAIVLGNSGTTVIRGWTLVFPVDEGVKVVAVKNAEIVSPVDPVTLQNAPHNGVLLPSEALRVQLSANGPTQNPEWFEINGVSCIIAR